MKRLMLAAAMAASLPAAAPLGAAPAQDAALARLQARDQQLFAVGWRLAAANAPFCADARPALGFGLIDAGGFGDPAAVRRQLRLAGELAVGAVAPGSPAAAAGIAVNDSLLAIAGVDIATRFPRSKPGWRRLVDVSAAIDAAAARGAVSLTLVTAGGEARTVTVTPVPACPTRFEVLDSGGKAMAEGTRVIFGRDFPGFGYPEDEFAAAVAHELAHNLLRHRALLDEKGRSLGNVRSTEREADRLMPWLLANAGWPPDAALRFMRRWGPRHDGGLFRNRNHEGWDERAEAIAVEVQRVAAMRQATGKANWSRGFERENLRAR